MSDSKYLCRKASLDDDLAAIAKYIHLTDIYIYPKISQNPSNKLWVDFISECAINENNIFYIENISVVTYDDDIVGIACVIPCQKKLEITANINIPLEFLVKIQPVVEGYFSPLIEESYSYNGYNIVNVCIDEKQRGKGLGNLLISHCINEYGSQTIHLDVIASNVSAIQLYRKFGFETENEYMGYSGNDMQLPCYHMVRKPNR